MEEEIINFIKENALSYADSRKKILPNPNTIFKTKDAKNVANSILQHISKKFFFADTANIFNVFSFTTDEKEITRRQVFFSSCKGTSNEYLNEIVKPSPSWRVPYSIAIATEDESLFLEMRNKNMPARLIISESDLPNLEQIDLVYVINCEEYSRALEMLPGAVFVNNVEDIYLERNLVDLSGWKNNLMVLKDIENLPEKMKLIVGELQKASQLLEQDSLEEIDEKKIENALKEINNAVQDKLRNFTVGGNDLMLMMQKGTLPPALNQIISESITATGLPPLLFRKGMPVQIDDEEVNRLLQKQSADKFTLFAKKILKEKQTLKNIPSLLEDLSAYLIYVDFIGGMGREIHLESEPVEISKEFSIESVKNKLIENAEPVSFNLSEKYPCSILTGANSGGKTTLLEHIIQTIVQANMGIPIEGKAKTPIFTEVYYFAKNKGSANKGAFETLLTQLSSIKHGRQTLILADEVEAVTEPGVAGKIMQATIEYFIPRGCFMVIATHLGQELQKRQPENARIDGIEAIGLDEAFELIVNHNPVLGKLARSTPELIVEKMARTNKNDYFDYLYKQIKESTA